MKKLTGNIFDIMKFAINDGPGIRTTVFLKGCPLDCLWCHNPESKKNYSEISFVAEKCILCGFCEKACRNQCHTIKNNIHHYDRSRCRRCGACAVACYAGALEIIGRKMTIDEVLAEVLEDKPFYETSGGGMTVSGGEPMAQFQFTGKLLRAAKKHSLHICLETSGFGAREKYISLAPLVDIWLYDFKESDSEKHLKYTGVSNESILKNLFALDSAGARMILRCPIVPGLNDRPGHLKEIAGLANRLTNIIEINILPYHPLGKSKSSRLGIEYRVNIEGFPEEDQIKIWIDTVQGSTGILVKRG